MNSQAESKPPIRLDWRRSLASLLIVGLILAILWLSSPLAGPARVWAQDGQTESAMPVRDLQGTQKHASARMALPGEELAYAIRLRNRAPAEATVDVTDQLPSLVQYIPGSASPAAVFDGVAATLSWSEVNIPAQGETLLSYRVTAGDVSAATLITNTATITAGDGSFERQDWVLLVPELPAPGTSLQGSHKFASRRWIASGETLNYTIRLINSGADDAVAQVTDPLPAEVDYVLGSAPAAAYEAGTKTLSWTDVPVPGRSAVTLTFAVTAAEVEAPTSVVNTATIQADDETFEREVQVVVVPESFGFGRELSGSHKFASRHLVGPGEDVTYTIRLRNRGAAEATAQVIDKLPAEVSYAEGTAGSGAVYDEAAGTLTWDAVPIPPQSEVLLTFGATAAEVSGPTLALNTASITTNGVSFDRRSPVLVMPEPPQPGARLQASQKLASQHHIGPGETLSYTIRLHNSGTAEALAQVTDQLPAELGYVLESAKPEASYDEGEGTLSWSDVVVPVNGEVSLSFTVNPVEVDAPVAVTNVATITTDAGTVERSARVVLLPERPASDSVPPVVHSLTIDDQDVLDNGAVTLHIDASDDVALRWMYIKEWQWTGLPQPHWELVQTSGWIPFQADYDWTLGEGAGVHYVGVWVGDGANNRSHVRGRELDFASLVQPGATIPPLGVVPYMVYYDAGVDVTASLTQVDGEAQLYVWHVGNLGRPISTGTQEVAFTTEQAGTYVFAVRGAPGDIYDLTIEPAGGPRPAVDVPPRGQLSQESPGAQQQNSPEPGDQVADDLASLFMVSGLDPLEMGGDPEAPGSTVRLYLPMVVR